jgi:hypothetical protein
LWPRLRRPKTLGKKSVSDMSSTDYIVIAAFSLLVASGFVSSFVSSRRLKHWSEVEGVTVLKKRYAVGLGSDLYARGLFAGWCYYVKVEDRERHVFQGWVRVGGLLAAIRNAKIEVQWDNRPAYLRSK